MDSQPALPSYAPPPVPAALPGTGQGMQARHAVEMDRGGAVDAGGPAQWAPDTSAGQQQQQQAAQHNGDIIPPADLVALARQHYHTYSSRLAPGDSSSFGSSSSSSSSNRTISLLEASEQFYEDAARHLELQDYHAAASAYIEGYVVFKFAERLNTDPSLADLINSLRQIYASGLFAKLKDITDDRFVREKEREFFHYSANSPYRTTGATYHESTRSNSDVRTLDPQARRPADAYRSQTVASVAATAATPHSDAYHRDIHRYHSTENLDVGPRLEPPRIPAPRVPAPRIPPPPLPAPVPQDTAVASRPRMELPRGPGPDPGPGPYHRTSVVPLSSNFSVCGLQNFGNTCYLNSIIQCLYNIREFSHFFKANAYVDFVHRPQHGKAREVCLAYGLGSLFRVMDKNSGCTVAPTRFFNFLLAISEFRKYDQQDAQEALMMIFGRLHDELCDNTLVPQRFPTACKRYIDDSEYSKWFDSKLKTEKLSPIGAFFEGQQMSALQCQICGFSSRTYSCFNILSLNLPPAAARSSQPASLEDLVAFYTASERLQGTDAWNCPECGKRRLAVADHERSRMQARHEQEMHTVLELNLPSAGPVDEIFDVPKDGKSKFFFRRRKDKAGVADTAAARAIQQLEQTQDSEIRELESQLRRDAAAAVSKRTTCFLSLPAHLVVHIQRSVKGARLATNIKYPLVLEMETAAHGTVRYKLQSTINHSGNSANSGHYTALCNKSDHLRTARWCQFNDDQFVLDLSHGDIMRGIRRLTSHDVYLLFYERIDR